MELFISWSHLNGKPRMTELGGNRNWQAMPTGNARAGVPPELHLNL